MTDITELAQSHELLIANGNETANLLRHLANNEIDSDYFAVVSECESYGKETDAELSITEFALRAAGYVDELVEALEKAQTINAAAEKLVRCKGRYHSEQNYRALAALFGVTTPDLPPLEHENVHYADAAEMEIAVLRQRIAELESRTITVKMPKLKMLEDYLAEVAVEERKAILLGVRMEFHRALNAEGIKWEAE
ncbi:TPA: hypothetical protein ACF3JK_003890 [Klebsiella aerogenes]